MAETKSMHGTHVVSFLDMGPGLRDIERTGGVEY